MTDGQTRQDDDSLRASDPLFLPKVGYGPVSDALKKRKDDALAPSPQEEVPAPVVAIALSDRSYWQRFRRIVAWQMEEYLKKDFLYSLIVAIFIGALTLLWEGTPSATTLYWAMIGFLAVFVARFGQHAIKTPKLIDSATRKALNASEQRLAELTKHKLTFEVDQRGSSLTKVRVEQSTDGSSVRIMLDLQLRFDNQDPEAIFMRGLKATFHRGGIKDAIGARDVTTWFAILQAMSNGVLIDLKYFKDGMQIADRQVTDFYVVRMMIAIDNDEEIKGVDDLVANDYIRVTMKAGGHQPDLSARIIPYWNAAATPEGTTQLFIFNVKTLEKDYLRLDDF